MMTTNHTLVRRYFEELLSAPGQLDVADEILSDDVVFENPISKRAIVGINDYRSFALRWYEGFPDRVFTVDETVSEGSKIVAQFTITGTHGGTFGGTKSSNNPIEVRGVNIFLMEGGKIKHVHAFFNPLELWRPIGLFPGLAAGGGSATPEQVANAIETYCQSFNNKDRDSFLSVFASDSVVSAPVGTAPVVGLEALGTWFEGMINAFDRFEFVTDDLFICGSEAAILFSINLYKGDEVTLLRGVDVFSVDGSGKIVGIVGYH
jgi:steroid delta-isomerase-like uncharacterized protein